MTNTIDWKDMTIAAVGLLALVFNPASDRGRAVFAKYFAPVQGWVEQASARSQEAVAEAQMRMVWARATSPVRLPALVEKQVCIRTARELRAELCARRAELRQVHDLRLVVVRATDAARAADSF
jgi:hypothetical protein